MLITEGSQLDSGFCSRILKKTPFEGDKNNLTIQSIFRSMNHSQGDESVKATHISI